MRVCSMAVLNIYKATKTKNSKVEQTYILGGLYVSLYPDKGIMLSYLPSQKKGKHSQLNMKKGTKEYDFFKSITDLRSN